MLTLLRSPTLDYIQAQKRMQQLVANVKIKKSPGYVWFLEHNPVITVATRTPGTDLINPQVPVVPTNRGGKATYHGPGQRIVYVILPLALFNNDLRLYVRTLEQWILDALDILHIKVSRDKAGVGIWHEGKKIAALGVHVSQGVTSHGLAINVDVDPQAFQQIIPCGIHDKGVISLSHIRPGINMHILDEALMKTFEHNFGCELLKE